jgi:hypothetical protein
MTVSDLNLPCPNTSRREPGFGSVEMFKSEFNGVTPAPRDSDRPAASFHRSGI